MERILKTDQKKERANAPSISTIIDASTWQNLTAGFEFNAYSARSTK